MLTLSGRFISLVPLESEHAADLFHVLNDPDVCQFLLFGPHATIHETRAFIDAAQGLIQRGESIVFAQIWNQTGMVIGSTRLLDVRPAESAERLHRF